MKDFSSPWAITPSRLSEMAKISEKLDIAAKAKEYKAFLNDDMDFFDGPKPSIVGQTAVVPVRGVLEQRLDFYAWIFGGVTAYEAIKAQIAEALDNPKIAKIVLDIDSPGGSVFGVAELAELIYQSRQRKEIVAIVNNVAASAAYWLASAASSVIMASDTAIAGSIGIVALYCDYSKAEDMAGIKVTEVVSGKYKRAGSEHRPITPEDLAILQERTDKFYGIFVDSVARYRGVSAQAVVESMADGRIFVGQDAVTAGLVDGVDFLPAQRLLPVQAWRARQSK